MTNDLIQFLINEAGDCLELARLSTSNALITEAEELMALASNLLERREAPQFDFVDMKEAA